MIREEWDEEEGIFEAYSGGTICWIGQTGGKLDKWETSREFWDRAVLRNWKKNFCFVPLTRAHIWIETS